MPPPRRCLAGPVAPWDGVLLVDKPSGYTSHDVVAKIRGRFRIQKVGHGGTLDPLATGLLVLLTGRGTRLSDRIMGSDKTYEGIMRLGIATDSQDADGVVLEEKPWDHVTDDAVAREMASRVGDQMQIPPMVSAIKKNGVPLYKLARKGETIEREPRLIHVYRFNGLGRTGPEVRFELRCTKGTYVRTLCADIGVALGCGAHLQALRRTESGCFNVANAAGVDDLCALEPGALLDRIIPLRTVLSLLG
jgi:tRNA pseudouridine55 synthase